MTRKDLPEILDDIEKMGFHEWLVKFLTESFLKARKGKRKTQDEHKFELNWAENILNLAKSIEERSYKPGSSIAFVVFEPMVREIFAAPFRDRSAHHMVYEISMKWFDENFIDTSTSCREGKGTLWAIKKAQQQMLEVTNNCTEKAVVVKLDLQGYFMSLPRQKLIDEIQAQIDAQFAPYKDRVSARKLCDTCKFLWEQIILDDPVTKAVKKGDLKNWDPEVLPPRKSLYGQPPNKGIVIGNLTSQMASNIYLNLLDKFITETLGYKYYGRYVDDFYIMAPETEKEKLKKDIRVIEAFLRDTLKLTLHPKKRYFQSVYKGMPYLGARVYPRCLYPSDRLQGKFKKAIYDYDKGNGKIETVISYLGHMEHLDADNFIRKVFREVGWNFEVFMESKKNCRRPMRDLVAEMARKY